VPGPEELAANNGAVTTADPTPKRNIRRWVIVTAFVLVALAWAIAITYSVTVGGRSPERLTDAEASVVAAACADAQQSLEQLQQLDLEATFDEKADRVEQEDVILTAMIRKIRTVTPEGGDPATALAGWLTDWQRLVTAREQYVRDLRTEGAEARFVEPADDGVEPIANKMNDWILEQGTRTDGCNTGVLQVEVVEGPRVYGSESKT
jgi:hypothetical protein